MEEEAQTHIMHEQRCARKRAFYAQTEQTVVAGCYSNALHEPFLLFPIRLLHDAHLESPPGRHSKNRCSNGLSDSYRE